MAKKQQENCPHCGSYDIRPSRVHRKDPTFKSIIYSPYRCRNCRERHWVVSRRFKQASTSALAAGIISTIAIVGVLYYATPIATTSLNSMAENGQASTTHILAEQGHADAQYELGLKYLKGDGVTAEKPTAIKWLAAAAEQGHSQAKQALTNAYLNYGARDSQEQKQAIQWLTQAAEEGQSEAQFILGNMYAEGQGVIQDFQQAAEWLQQAANAGHVESMYRVGMMHVIGDGVPKDRVQAYVWFNLAAAEGNHQAFIARSEVSQLLSAEQITEAQTLSREWQPSVLGSTESDGNTPTQITQVEH